MDGFDLSGFNEFAPADYMQYELNHLDYRVLSEKFVPLVFDLRQPSPPCPDNLGLRKLNYPGHTQTQIRVTRSGRACAVAWWFLLELDSKVALTLTLILTLSP